MDDLLFFEHKHDHVTVYEKVVDREIAPRIDGREVIAAAYMTRAEALDRPLSPVVRRYLETHGGPAAMTDPGPGRADAPPVGDPSDGGSGAGGSTG